MSSGPCTWKQTQEDAHHTCLTTKCDFLVSHGMLVGTVLRNWTRCGWLAFWITRMILAQLGQR